MPLETLDRFHDAYDDMRRYNRRGLERVYNFGQLADVLSRIHGWGVLSDEINLSVEWLQTYARLYRKYPTVRALQDTAERLHSWSVSRLAGAEPSFKWEHYNQCTNCGSTKTVKKRRVPKHASPEMKRHGEELLRAAEERAARRRAHERPAAVFSG